MPKAHALLVGLKSVDPNAYGGWDGTGGCWGCELDVDNIERILLPLGYQVKTLKTKQATRSGILSALDRAADLMTANDIFVFYYSGHGGQQPDYNNDEADGKDETLVAYDREVIDDKIHEALQRFRKDVRIVMISDSCNSGSNYRGIRTMPVKENSIFRPVANTSRDQFEINAQLIHFGGCRDGFTSAGYQGGGAFTIALCEAWNNGGFNGNYKALHTKICQVITTSQKPQYSEYGPVSDEFKNSRAFSLPSVPLIEGPIEIPVIDTEPVRAMIAEPGEKHEYRFTAINEGRYTIETQGRTDLVMALYGPDSDSYLIDEDDDSGNRMNPRIVTSLSPGTYYLRIQHYNSRIGTGDYNLTVTRQNN